MKDIDTELTDLGTNEPLTFGTNEIVVHRFPIYKFCFHISKMPTFKNYKNLKGKFDDEILTAAVQDVLHLQISIRATARKHSINHALLIRYIKKVRENLTSVTIILLKVSRLSMALM